MTLIFFLYIGGEILFRVFQQRIKRFLDIVGSVLFLIILSPLFIIISIAIKMNSPGKILYKQLRVGKEGKLFYLYKFRSMVENAENMGAGLYLSGDDDPRITKVGKILRKTSLDELPEIINIIKGDMSFVGPRPTLKYQVDKYNDYQKRRLEVLPGITGWAQINGRNSIPWSKRIELDIWYIDHFSLWLDFKILLLTIPSVFITKDVRHDQVESEVDDLGV
jgi:lipopolysaccharide/colanic/teichoic acid biosynthesis glycosyltransferase